MLSFTDQTQHTINLPRIPRRIVSLVPSQTELLFDLGLNEEVAGITKFCVHPQQWFHSKPKVGGTKQLNMDAIHALLPDLIIANKEENVKEQVEELINYYPVWISDVNTLDDAYEMITQVGAITGKERNALLLVNRIRSKFSQLPHSNQPLSAAYLIWQNPYMTVGGDTFIHAMLQSAGFYNAFSHLSRYPKVSLEDIRATNCDLVFLSSEPYPFKRKHIDELQSELPTTRLVLVDGEMFSWYGSRLAEAPAYFEKLSARTL
ncbi:MAG: ABC transporter substrate-binding protein [Chitinophagaceae bacterium]|nr:ABC transporter substrate-binding protein [Chitinophagaceae bacterium]